MGRWFRFLPLLGLVMAVAAQAEETKVSITDIAVIPIKNGVNPVEHLTPDGRDGIIVQAWRDNGNAHGYSRYMVLVDMGRKSYDIATVDTHDRTRDQGNSEIDTVRDDPHTGEDVISTVKFAHAKVGGVPTIVLIIAARDLSKAQSLPEATPVYVEFYRLVRNPDNVGWPPYYFDLLSRQRLKGTYGNADCALKEELGIHIPRIEAESCIR